MDEYFVVPKHRMASAQEKLANVQSYKEPPEAFQVLSLDTLTNQILHQKSVSEWEKASQLSSTLERFLALKPKVFNEETAPPVAPSKTLKQPVAKPKPSKPLPKLSEPRVRIPKFFPSSTRSSIIAPSAPRKPKTTERKTKQPIAEENDSDYADAESSPPPAPPKFERSPIGLRQKPLNQTIRYRQEGKGRTLKKHINWIFLK